MGSQQTTTKSAPKVESARRRATFAKAGVTVASAAVFGLAALLARNSYAGHHKDPARTLVPPQKFVSIVRQNELKTGNLAPPEAPPSQATAPS